MGGVLQNQMRTSAFFGAKNSECFEIDGVSARTRGEGVEPVQTKRPEGESVFRDFFRTSFMDGSLGLF